MKGVVPRTYISKYRKAQIIGMYKQGASISEICLAVDVDLERVLTIIETYFKIRVTLFPFT